MLRCHASMFIVKNMCEKFVGGLPLSTQNSRVYLRSTSKRQDSNLALYYLVLYMMQHWEEMVVKYEHDILVPTKSIVDEAPLFVVF